MGSRRLAGRLARRLQVLARKKNENPTDTLAKIGAKVADVAGEEMGRPCIQRGEEDGRVLAGKETPGGSGREAA